MSTKLKDMLFSSVDFCPQGANPDADIKIVKSKEEALKMGEDRFTKLCNKLRKSKFPSEEVALINRAMEECAESIEKDESLEGIEKFEMLKENMEDFAKYFLEASKQWDSPNYETEDIEKMGVLSDVLKGIDVDKIDGSDSEILKTILEKYKETDSDPKGEKEKKPLKEEKPKEDIEDDPEDGKKEEEMEKSQDTVMQKAFSKLKKEFEEMKKEQESAELRKVAEQYVCIGKKVDELVPFLSDLKKSGEANYQAFIDTLDQFKKVKMDSGILKTYGSDKAIPIEKMDNLNSTVAQIIEKNPKISQAEAIVKAYEMNPDLPEMM